jgi:hypothetical protein
VEGKVGDRDIPLGVVGDTGEVPIVSEREPRLGISGDARERDITELPEAIAIDCTPAENAFNRSWVQSFSQNRSVVAVVASSQHRPVWYPETVQLIEGSTAAPDEFALVGKVRDRHSQIRQMRSAIVNCPRASFATSGSDSVTDERRQEVL